MIRSPLTPPPPNTVRTAVRTAVVLAVCLSAVPCAQARSLDVEERVRAQEAIERIYYQHRLWPAENPGPKPPFETAMPRAVLAARAEDALKKSAALDAVWGRPLTDAMLQAEMDRMARNSKDPATLLELFEVLGDDPALIAECLVRPILADREIRRSYAFDGAIHGGLRQSAAQELARLSSTEGMRQAAGRYAETTWVRRDPAAADPPPQGTAPETALDALEWREMIGRLHALFNGSRDASGPDPSADSNTALPLQQLTALQEDEWRFYAVAVLEAGEGRIRTATIEWPKTPFETWWGGRAASVGAAGGQARGAFVLPVVRATVCTADTWQPMHVPPPSARYQHTAIWTGAEMIVWGGWNGTTRYRDGGRYYPAGDYWLPTSTVDAPEARTGHSAVWTGTQMIVFGGQYSDPLNTLGCNGRRYNPVTDTWSTMASLFWTRYNHKAVWTGSLMLIWGGYSETFNFVNWGHRYDPASNTWTDMSSTGVPSRRHGHVAAWSGTQMIVWGGRDSMGDFNTGGRYNPSTNTWTATSTDNAPTARSYASAVWADGEMIVWGGGILVPPTNTGGRYNPLTDTWTATSTTDAPTARAYHTAVWTGSAMLVWGGACGTNCYLGDGGRYDPVSNGWTAIPGTDAPAARKDHSAVWTETEMIVWGGRDGTGNLNSLGRYVAGSDAWVAPLASSPWTPEPRIDHATVWTGAELIVWGGWNSTYVGTGARYQPALDTWTPLAPIGAPPPRNKPTAVWDGREVILWGGYWYDTVYHWETMGGRYDPALNAWMPTTPVDAPLGRMEHTAVWTGREMIVWGGERYAGTWSALNSGGRYDPWTDAWTPTGTASAPAARYYHTAVWTGQRMVIWGGTTSGVTNTGSRYDPLTDAWSATSTTGAPTARFGHAVVWTGAEMIVWGGRPSSLTGLNSGGRYNPSTDLWTGMTTTGAPVGRYSTQGVWMGNGMIVWGGWWYESAKNLYHFERTGGRYLPFSDTWTPTSTVQAPAGRYEHSCVWTGAEMLIWGGESSGYAVGGGRYCLGYSVDLWLTKTASPDPVWLNEPLTYTMTVSNRSVVDATNAVLTDAYPAGVAVNSATPSQGTCDTSGNPITCALGTIPAGETATVVLEVASPTEGQLVNSAAIAAAESDFNPANNTSTVSSWALDPDGDQDGDTVINSEDCRPTDPTVWALPSAFALSYPPAGGTDAPLNLTLDWGDSANAAYYTVYFGPSSPAPYLQNHVAASQFAATNLSINTTYYWRVVAVNACGILSSPEYSFTTICPAPGAFGVTSPADGATGQNVSLTLNWQDSQYAATYDLYFGTSPSPALYQSGLTASQAAVSGLSIDTPYYWRVVAVNICGTTASAEWSFTTACYNPLGFMLGSPWNQATDVFWDVPFDWADATFADTYDLYLGTAYPPPLHQSGIMASELFATGLHPDLTYYWRVVAVNHCGATGSETWSFTTQCNPPGLFNLLAPPDADMGASVNAALDWEDEPNASSYALFLGTSTPPPLYRDGLTASGLEVPGLIVNTTYYWRVEAQTSCGNSTSAEWSFTTAPAGITFVGTAGTPVDEYMEDTRAHLRVQDPAADLDPLAPDTLGAAVSSAYGADAEPLTLTETGNATGVFEGSVALLFGAGVPDGVLQTGNSGEPDWLFDTLTAAYGILTDTARTAGSVTTLLHADGRDATAYATGWPVRVRVEDHAVGGPASVDTATVTLRMLDSLDEETLLLTETGPATGVFEGVIASRIAAPTPGDATLQAMPTETLRAWHTNTHSPTESSDTAYMQRSLVEFIDAAGLPTETFVESTRVFARIYDAWGNGDPGMAEVVSADLYSSIAGDYEYFDLRETGTDTGIFEGSLPMVLSWGDSNNGVLETTENAPPDFAFDTLRIWYWDDISEVDEDFASTVGSRTLFIDDLGRETETYPIGSLVRLRVLDGNRNADPATADTTQVLVMALGTGDTETVTMTETGPDTDWFMGTLPTQKNGTASPGDGALQAQAGETIQATHQDYLTWSQSEDAAGITGSSIEFIGADGASAEGYMESTRAYVRVFDSAANMNSGMPDTTTASLTSLYGLDAEPVMLTETGDDTNIFEGSIALETGPASPSDGLLQTGNSGAPAWLFDTLTAAHDAATDTALTLGSRTWFVDAYGREAAAYPVGGRIYLRVEDHNADDPFDIDSVIAVLETAGGDEESLLLRETGPSTGVFEGSFPSAFGAPSVGDGTLQAMDIGEAITAIHMDLYGPTTSSDTAQFVEATVEFIDAGGAPAEVVLESSRIHLRVTAPSANMDPGYAEFVNLEVFSTIAGDLTGTELTETGDDTGVFEGSIPLVLGMAAPSYPLETYENPPPAFSFDTLTASFNYGAATDTAVTLGSRTWFMDGSGRIAESYPVGAAVHLRVLDFNFNAPLTVDTVPVRVRSLGTGDEETVVLTETGPDTGEFTGSLPSGNSGAPSVGDGTLQTLAGETIRAEHRDFLDWSQSEDEAVMAASSVEFVDADGSPAGEYLESTRAYVRVFDRAANGNAAAPDTTTAQVSSLHGMDGEPLLLTETGDDTNVFEGSIALDLGAASPGDGTLQTGQSGPPEWEFDTLTAAHGPLPEEVSDTAVTVGSRTRFIDALGDETSAYAVGGRVYVRVESHTDNDPTMVDMVPLTLRSLATLDEETFPVTETGTDTGVFEGFLPSAAGPPAVSDGTLQAQAGETIEAEHEYAAYRTMNSTDSAVMVQSIVEFVDAAGAPAETYLESSRVYVRLTYPGGNWDPESPESAWADIDSLIAGDLEGIVLTETGGDTGIFEGSIPMALGWGTSWNGVLETDEMAPPQFAFDTLTVTHGAPGGAAADTARTIGSRTEFTDAAGQAVDGYEVGAAVHLAVQDHNANNDPLTAETVPVILTAPLSGDQETVIGTETGPDTGSFQGSIPSQTTVSAVEDGVLTVQAGETIAAEHGDLLGWSSSGDTAVIAPVLTLWITKSGAEDLDLDWNDAPFGFEVLRSASPDMASPLVRTAASNWFTEPGVQQDGLTYYYLVRVDGP